MSVETIKIMTLLDELEELFNSSSKMPFSEKGLVDIEMASKIIEEIRLNLPRDIQEAQWIRQEKDRILDEAKGEYNKVIMSAKDQAQYLVDSNVITREAEKRASALLSEAQDHSRYMKLKSYEYVDKILFDMQNDIGSITEQYVQPMNNYFANVINNINIQVNSNRDEMRHLAEKLQMSDVSDENNADMPETEAE